MDAALPHGHVLLEAARSHQTARASPAEANATSQRIGNPLLKWEIIGISRDSSYQLPVQAGNCWQLAGGIPPGPDASRKYVTGGG
jgi:hypothetical protein